ncbi:c-type cytochrome [Paracoccus aminophilus]|nr:cytochrome c [Paracoccus aminophilus]
MTFASTGTIVAAGFTEEQAKAGETAYQSNCSQCHGIRLEGPEAPALFGQDIMGNWDTAGGLYDFISVAMPPAEPGKLGEETYLNIIAYVMQKNGASAGDKALTTADMASVELVAETKDGAAQLAQANQETTIEAGDTNVPQAFTWGKELPKFKK